MSGSDLEEVESQGVPVWRQHVGDPVLESNITRRVDFALFTVEALGNDDLVHEAPAIVSCNLTREPFPASQAAASASSATSARGQTWKLTTGNRELEMKD